MSLLAHFREYYTNWMESACEINLLFGSRPPVTFTAYPEEEEITGRPWIYCAPAKDIHTRVPDSEERMLLVSYYRERLGYEIKNPNDFVIFLDNDNTVAYPPEVLYVAYIEEYVAEVASMSSCENPPNPFTIVI